MRRTHAFTLIEVIVTIVILGVLSAGTFVSLEHLYLRSAKSKALNELSMVSQISLDQLSAMLYERVPSSVIGYNPTINTFQSIYAVDTNFTILEWIGTASEAHKLRAYSGFADIQASLKPKLSSIGVNTSLLTLTQGQKFQDGNISKLGLMFAGSLDDGALYYSNEFNTTFGWHGNHTSTQIYDFSLLNDGNISFTSTTPAEIYEKYYLLDSAYAVARGADVNASLCPTLQASTNEDTLFLFYNYRPWKGETFCADTGSFGLKSGNVTVLTPQVSGFQAGVINGTIYLNLTMNKVIRGSENNVTISKQKAVY